MEHAAAVAHQTPPRRSARPVSARTVDSQRLRALRSTIDRLRGLGDNWDSYGGKCPTVEAARDAIDLARVAEALGAPAPSVVPSPSGGFQLEWYVGPFELEVDCLGDDRYVAVFDDNASGESWDAELGSGNLERVVKALRLIGALR